MPKYKVLVTRTTIDEVGIEGKSPALAIQEALNQRYDESDVIRTQNQGTEDVVILGYWDETGTYHEQHQDEMSEEEYEGKEDE